MGTLVFVFFLGIRELLLQIPEIWDSSMILFYLCVSLIYQNYCRTHNSEKIRYLLNRSMQLSGSTSNISKINSALLLSQLVNLMIIKYLNTLHRPIAKAHSYHFGSGPGFISFIRQMLNRLANQQKRTLREERDIQISARQSALEQVADKPAKTPIQAERKFQDHQKIVSNLEAGRLQRIDNILGTRTYFHETKLYQQRLDSEHVMNISRLHSKYKQTPREELNATNPQIKPTKIFKTKKKYAKVLQKLKKYPSPYPDLQKLVEKQDEKQSNNELLKMLSEESIYSSLSHASLNLTLESLQKQKIYLEKQDGLIQAEFDQQPLTRNGFTYFQPTYSNSLYRVPSTAYSNTLRSSIQKFIKVEEQEQFLQEMLTIDEVYQCLQEFYYDERVSAYIKKIENNEMDYFLSNICVSPDNKHLIVVIDLLGNRKEYVAMYKYVGNKREESRSFFPSNCIFNLKPEIHIENDSTAYFIQRSEQGLYVQFVQTQLLSEITSPIEHSEQKLASPNRNNRIVYKCPPYKTLRILTDKSNGESGNIVLQENEAVAEEINNKIYVLNHEDICQNNSDKANLQEITRNSWNADKLEKILKSLPEYLQQKYTKYITEETKIKFYHDCLEVRGLGYILIRYLIDENLTDDTVENQLKHCFNRKIAHFATIIPYKGIDLGLTPQQKQTDHYTKNSLINQSSEITAQIQNQNVEKNIQKLTDQIKHSSLQLVISPTQVTNNKYRLLVQEQSTIFICKEQQYFTSAMIQQLSTTNIYLVMTLSLQSVYNNHYMHVYPLRAGIKPYSLYLDGLPLKIAPQGKSANLQITVETPLLPTKFTYSLWNKQLKQVINQRIYTEKITIDLDADQAIEIKILSLERMMNPDKIAGTLKDQIAIFYVPSSKKQRIEELTVRKILEKGVILVQLTKGPGIFGTDIVDLMRGTKSFHINYVKSILKVIEFIKENISQNIGLYAKGGPACYSSLLINILDNQDGQFFDGSVLHEGIYNLSQVPNQQTRKYSYFFGQDTKYWQKRSLLDFSIINPKLEHPEEISEPEPDTYRKLMVRNLHNIIFSNLDPNERAESRRMIQKIRKDQNLLFESVYLKEYDTAYDCDLYNLGFLYYTMKEKAQIGYMQNKNAKIEQKNEEVINEREREGDER